MGIEGTWADRLRTMEVFHDLPLEVLALLGRQMQERQFEPGETFVEQGAPGDGLYVLIEGAARGWLQDASGRRRALAEFGVEEVIGEMALITGEPRSASIEAIRPTRALWLEKSAFNDLAFRYPELGMVLTAIMAMRLGEQAVDGLGGKVVGNYRIRRSIGRGGMAVVYEAERVEGGEQVALKMMSYRLLYERGAMSRFQREAEIITTLHHPHVVRIQELFSAYRTSFLVMEYCDGRDLAQHVEAGGPWPEKEVRRLAGQLSQALSHVHAQGVVHRDLKPNNVLLTSEGRAKLTDFGLARAPYAIDETPITEARGLLGTPLYMAPEQISGRTATPSSDVYSLACVLYETLTGHPPVEADSLGDLVQGKRQFVLPPAGEIGEGIQPDLHGFLSAALSPDEARRPAAGALAEWAGLLRPSDGAYGGLIGP